MLISPALIFIILLFLLPLLSVFIDTFKTKAGAWSIQEYRDFAQDPVVQKVYLRTIRLATIVTVISALIGYPVSYAIARMPSGRRSVVMSLVILPLMTNPVARTYSWLVILGRLGLVNNLVETLHLSERPLRLLVLPGSRRSEVTRLMGLFGEVLTLLRAKVGPFEILLPAVDHVRAEIEARSADWPVKPTDRKSTRLNSSHRT